ncbi:MAG TPA: ABC transporter permease [Gemmatimonadaceae bacterium]|nr:ABC transporter permease [Gemmatimonadaceae bacterium]
MRDRVRLFLGFRRHRDMDDRFVDEMRFHVEMATEANVRAGMTPAEARRVALITFGGKEQWRESAANEVRSAYLEDFVHDVRYAIRGLVRSPTFTIAAVTTLGLSIGATTSIFSVINAALLRALPYPHADRIVAVCERNTVNPSGEPCSRGGFSVDNFATWRGTAKSFDAFAAFREGTASLAAPGRDAVSAQARVTSASLFVVVGARPALGRFFTAEEDQPGGPDLLVLSHAFWQEYFAGDSGIVGRHVSLEARQYTVVGVTAPGFGVYEPVDVWIPMRLAPAGATPRGRSLRALALVRPGVTLEQANREMQVLAARTAHDQPQYNANMTAFVVPLRERLVGNSARLLWTLLSAVGFLLLIACANVANLLLTRASAREREIAVRISLGASPTRLVRQLVTESLVLSAVSTIVGFGLGMKGTRALVALLPSDLSVQALADVSVDWRLMLFAAAVGVATGLVFGAAPSLHALRSNVQETLKEGGRGGSGQARSTARLRNAFVIAEITVALVLLVGAGLMVRSFTALQRVDLGIRTDHVLTARMSLPSRLYPSDTSISAFVHDAESRIATLPGVSAVGAISYLPLTGDRSVTGFSVEGRPVPPEGTGPFADVRAITPGYFRAIGMRIKEGRGFTDADVKGSPKVGVVNETFARTTFPHESAIGHFITYPWAELERFEIVGVVDDVHEVGPNQDAPGEMYRPLSQFPYSRLSIVLRGSGDPSSYVAPLRKAVREIDRNIPLAAVEPLSALEKRAVVSNRLSAALFSLFGILGLLLAAVGIYGVVSYTVEQRRHEIAVRVALGATRGDVVRSILMRGAGLCAIGIGIGMVVAFAGANLMQKLLFGIPPRDATTFAVNGALLAIIGLLAAYVPGLRAARVDPARALRGE